MVLLLHRLPLVGEHALQHVVVDAGAALAVALGVDADTSDRSVRSVIAESTMTSNKGRAPPTRGAAAAAEAAAAAATPTAAPAASAA